MNTEAQAKAMRNLASRFKRLQVCAVHTGRRGRHMDRVLRVRMPVTAAFHRFRREQLERAGVEELWPAAGHPVS
jgi:hypothetical protein